jgi:hypothetical protein
VSCASEIKQLVKILVIFLTSVVVPLFFLFGSTFETVGKDFNLSVPGVPTSPSSVRASRSWWHGLDSKVGIEHSG